jgi:dipeptidyl-peptidase-4
LAYIRFDESEVPEFSMSMFHKDLYPTVETFKYPKAGEKHAVVSLHLVDVNTIQQKKVDLGIIKILYCKNAMVKDANAISALVLNRHQDN